MSQEREALERAILCVALQDPEVVGELMSDGVLHKGMFSDKRNQVVWRAMVSMHQSGQRVDPLTVSAFLREHGADKHVGGIEYIGMLLTEVSVYAPLIDHARGWVSSLRKLALATDDASGTAQRHQVSAAKSLLSRTKDTVMTYPIQTLAKLRGGWSPGEVDVLAAASNSGKTTLLQTCARKWVREGRRVFYAGFELPAANLRLQWAAHEAGYLPGDIISGEYLLRNDADEVRAKISLALEEQESRVDLLRCADAAFVDVDSLSQMGKQAAEWGADVFIIDHIDHVSGKGDLHVQSRQVVSTVLELGKATGVRYLIATQLNQSGLAQDFLRSHRPIREEYVKQGGHKKEVSTFMFGLARAIRKDVTPEELKAVRERRAEIQTIEEKYASQVNVMKHRNYGERVGSVRLLSWERGEYTDYMSEEDRRTKRPILRRNDLALVEKAG